MSKLPHHCIVAIKNYLRNKERRRKQYKANAKYKRDRCLQYARQKDIAYKCRKSAMKCAKGRNHKVKGQTMPAVWW